MSFVYIKCLSTKTMNTYTEIEEVMSYKSNFKNYRDVIYIYIFIFFLFLYDM